MSMITGWVAPAVGQPLIKKSVDVGELKPEDVEIAVEYCGICHSDLSMMQNDWGFSSFPFIPGHEVTGRVVALGERAKGLKVGQRVGVGWSAESCMHCRQCLGGSQHLCPELTGTIVGRNGGFADRVRAHWAWTIPLPENLDPSTAGPMLCGGVTVFSPLAMYATPLSHVGIVGIGGLGHMGVKFARAYGCEVTAFTSSPSKFDEAKGFGGHQVISSRDTAAMTAAAGTLDLIISTVNVPLDWPAMLQMLRPNGRLHVVGAVLEPLAIPAFGLIPGQKQLSGSPTGSPVMLGEMLEFAARHGVTPQVEHFPMNDVNKALDHLHAGKARYRIVLDAVA